MGESSALKGTLLFLCLIWALVIGCFVQEKSLRKLDPTMDVYRKNGLELVETKALVGWARNMLKGKSLQYYGGLQVVKDDFLVATDGRYPSVENFGEGFIIAYHTFTSPSKVRTVKFDATFTLIPGSDMNLNDQVEQKGVCIFQLVNGSYLVCYDVLISYYYIYCHLLDTSAVPVGQEYDLTNGQYYADQCGFPRGIGFKDGTHGVFWAKVGSDPGQGVWGVIVNSTGRHFLKMQGQYNQQTYNIQVTQSSINTYPNSQAIVVFSAFIDDSGHGVGLQLFYTNNFQNNAEHVLVNQQTTDSQVFPTISQILNGSLVICWCNFLFYFNTSCHPLP